MKTHKTRNKTHRCGCSSLVAEDESFSNVDKAESFVVVQNRGFNNRARWLPIAERYCASQELPELIDPSRGGPSSVDVAAGSGLEGLT
jgi:hypothetical protein